VAIEVRVGEIGKPCAFTELAPGFLGEAAGDLSDALTAAAKTRRAQRWIDDAAVWLCT
jgi:hypothetical protein